ncbi:phage major capsid protein [Bacillus sp. SJS]|uniref:phage major capsid protein n=1 Tax=Bacillus sp. SJS TaxID=1423321 RepID=UPI0004DD219F|nr:phage major capsid protein [Bacillus sp. SJS]KZZ86231.1 hypothetical protein AS29_001255 [Bacillus sp. SJS]
MKIELRSNEVSLISDGQGLKVEGYVNKPGQLSEVLGSARKFREKIQTGAFQRAIESSKKDIHFLAEHDSKMVLASTRNGSLEIREDDQGLFMSARIAPTSWGRDYFTLITDGLIKNMSFGFRAIKDSWAKIDGELIRTVEELELFEVSAVKDPAYSQSTIAARGIDLIEEVQVPEKITEISERGKQPMEMKMEKRTNSEEMLEQYIRGQVDARSLTTTADGTAVIPENVADVIVKKMEEVSPAFSQAKKFESVAGSLKIPREKDGITGGFFGEGELIVEEQLQFDHVELKQKRIGAAIAITNQMVNDSAVDIVAYTQDLLARRLAKTAEKAIFNGDGAKEFTGILSDVDVVEITADQNSNPISPDVFFELHTAIHPDFLDGAAFYMTRTFFNEVAKMKDNNGHAYMQNGVVNGKIMYTLLGQPVHVTEALTTDNPVIFANMAAAYAVMVKKDMALQNVVDTTNVLRGSRLLVLDGYMDGAVYNPQSISKLKVIPLVPQA